MLNVMYEFSLEKWVLTGLQNGFSSQHQPHVNPPASGVLASCPPYWMMFSSPQQSRLASRHSSDFWEPNPRQRSHSLNPAVLRTKFAASDSEEEGERSGQKAQSSLVLDASEASCQRGQRKSQKAFVPDLLNPPTCLSSLPHQRRKNLRLSLLGTSEQDDTRADSQSKNWTSHCPDTRPTGDDEQKLTRMSKDVTVDPGAGDRNQNLGENSIWDYSQPVQAISDGIKAVPSLDPSGSLLPPPPLEPPSSSWDSSSELLSALSTEERELLGAITARGYPLHTAIIALQKKGRQTPEQILGYLVACEHLCQLGHDIAQVEEALEMFQNCERKAEEFLHLLSQFNEMGFQQNTIKEVLLVHENHRERALEELMMRVA
ncbi:uncharacterized protein ubap1lb [Aulostomus maculatus]